VRTRPGSGVKTLTAAALVALVGAVALGMLGMHGLSRHGELPAGDDRHPFASMTADAATHAAHAGHVADHIGPAAVMDDRTAATTMGADDAGGSVGHMAMLCAAMLLAAPAGLLLALRLRRLARGLVLTVESWARTAGAQLPARSDSGPPAVWEFSVVRC
jgi:hypothetical protein